MADKKISQLTALSAANLAPSTDVLAIVDTSATETKKIVAQDLVNGVLNVASAVGIGTSSPTEKLTVAGNIKLGTTGTTYLYGPSTTGRSFISNSDSSAYIGLYGSAYGSGLDSILSFVAGTTNTMTFNASGNLGLGVTPSAWTSSFKAFQFGDVGAVSWNGNTEIYLSNNYASIGSTPKYITTAAATLYSQASGVHAWLTAPSGTINTAISFTQAMTLDASGNLGVGTTSPAFRLDLKGSGATAFAQMQDSTAVYKAIYGVDSGGGVAGAVAGALTNHPFILRTNNTERARITSGGYLKVQADTSYQSATSSYNEISNSAANEYSLWIRQTNSTTPFGTYIQYPNGSPNGTGNNFILCIDSTETRATIRSNGGLANFSANNVNLSDERMKKDIVPLGSMWDKFKAIEIVAFKYKDQTHEDNNIGVIAQQVESVAPEFVDVDGFGDTPEDGVPLKTVYTTDMYHAAIKALQEAMTRIEQLEAKVAALEAK
jgi:hypothetical protein